MLLIWKYSYLCECVGSTELSTLSVSSTAVYSASLGGHVTLVT